MLAWIARGLRKGIVTSRYPRRPEPMPPGYRSRVEVTGATADAHAHARARAHAHAHAHAHADGEVGRTGAEIEELCPTGAISVAEDGRIALDRGLCILCGACVEAEPGRFRFAGEWETASRRREGVIVGPGRELSAEPQHLVPPRPTLVERARPLRRSVHIRHVDAGSDGAEEWEIQALTNPYYDMQRLGLYFTLAPRHADILLVTGAVTGPMTEPLRRTYDAMPEPKAVVAAGSDACAGGFASAGEVAGGVDRVLPVDVYVPGSPPSPIALLHGLLLAAGIVREAHAP